jgi:hypothetical protein
MRLAIARIVEMDSSWMAVRHRCAKLSMLSFSKSPYQKESDMNATIVGVDLAKNIFELAVADADWRIAQRQPLTRAKFLGFFVQLAPCQVVMEACGSARYWARRITSLRRFASAGKLTVYRLVAQNQPSDNTAAGVDERMQHHGWNERAGR